MESSRIVDLNVGGALFQTTAQTLASRGENFFYSLVSGRHQSQKDKNGAYFIDRDPKMFSIILNFLRTGRIILTDGIALKDVCFEAAFYCVDISDGVKHLRNNNEKYYALVRIDLIDIRFINRVHILTYRGK